MAEANRLSQSSKPEELDADKKEDLEKSDKLLDQVALKSSFMKIFSLQIRAW